MGAPYVVTGTLSNGRLGELDEALPLGDARVRVSIEPLPVQPKRPLAEFLAELREEKERRGHVPRSREEVDRELEEERASWDR